MDSYVHHYAQKAVPWPIVTGMSIIKMHYILQKHGQSYPWTISCGDYCASQRQIEAMELV